MLGETILPPELLQLIGARADGPIPSSTAAADPSFARPPTVIGTNAMPRLSGRETWILRCIADGDSNKHIARRIGIAEATVKVHVKAILRKIQLRNRTQAAIWAMKNKCSLLSTENSLPLQADLGAPCLRSTATRPRPVETGADFR
jgi:two-component system nitrate/nitrite response regulator NarL